MISYLEDTLAHLDTALEELEEQAEHLEGLKGSSGNKEKVAEIETAVLEKALAIRYLLQKCNSIMEGNFEVIDLLKQ